MRAKTYAFETDPDSIPSLKQKAVNDLQRAWKALRRVEDLSGDAKESKAAGRSVAFVDKALAELETG